MSTFLKVGYKDIKKQSGIKISFCFFCIKTVQFRVSYKVTQNLRLFQIKSVKFSGENGNIF